MRPAFLLFFLGSLNFSIISSRARYWLRSKNDFLKGRHSMILFQSEQIILLLCLPRGLRVIFFSFNWHDDIMYKPGSSLFNRAMFFIHCCLQGLIPTIRSYPLVAWKQLRISHITRRWYDNTSLTSITVC